MKRAVPNKIAFVLLALRVSRLRDAHLAMAVTLSDEGQSHLKVSWREVQVDL